MPVRSSKSIVSRKPAASQRFHEHPHPAKGLVAGGVDRLDHEKGVPVALDRDGLLERPVVGHVGRLGVDGDDSPPLGLPEDEEQVAHLLRREHGELGRSRVSASRIQGSGRQPEPANPAPVGRHARPGDGGESPEVRPLARNLDARGEAGPVVEVYLVRVGDEKSGARDLDSIPGRFRHAGPLELDLVVGADVEGPVVRGHDRHRRLGQADAGGKGARARRRDHPLAPFQDDGVEPGRYGRPPAVGRDLGLLPLGDVHRHAGVALDSGGRVVRRDRRRRCGGVHVDSAGNDLHFAPASLRRGGPAHLEERARADREERAVGEHDLAGAVPSGLDEVAVEERLTLPRALERRASGALQRHVPLDEDERGVAVLVGPEPADHATRVGLRLDGEPERVLEVLLLQRRLRFPEETRRPGDVRSGTRGPGGAVCLVEEVRRGRDLGSSPLLRGGVRFQVVVVADDAGSGHDDHEDAPGGDFPDGDDEPVEVRSHGPAELPSPHNFRDWRGLPCILIAQQWKLSAISDQRSAWISPRLRIFENRAPAES